MDKLTSFYKTEQYDETGEQVEKKDVEAQIHIVTNPEQLWENLRIYDSLGISRISLHNINTNHDHFIESFGAVIKSIGNFRQTIVGRYETMGVPEEMAMGVVEMQAAQHTKKL